MGTSLTTLTHELLSTILSLSESFADAVSLSSVDVTLREIWKTDSGLILRIMAGESFPGTVERTLAFEILFELLGEQDDGVKLTIEQTETWLDSVALPVQKLASTLCVSWSRSDE